jgi:hypothetical protein
MRRPSFSLVLVLPDTPSLERPAAEVILEQFLGRVRTLLESGLLPKVSIYLSGGFLQLAALRKGTLLAELRAFAEADRLEWLGGCWSDPLLPLLRRDAQERQIRRHLELVDRHLGVRPRGFWLPALTWEASLASLVADEGFEYTLLRDSQLVRGLSSSGRFDGIMTAEDQGRVLRILPSETAPAEWLQGRQYRKLQDFFQASAESESGDGWHIADMVFLRQSRGIFEQDWLDQLERFLRRAEEVHHWPAFRLLSEQVDQRPRIGSVGLSSSIGPELGLEPERNSCRELLLLQPECNLLHKKLLWLQRAIDRLPAGRERHTLEEQLQPAESSYWLQLAPTGGGMRMLEDRAKFHEILLETEASLRKVAGTEGIRLEVADFLGEGSKQLLCSGDRWSFLVEHAKGGRLRSLEYHPLRLNLVNGFHPHAKSGDPAPPIPPTPPASLLEPGQFALAAPAHAVEPACGFRDWILPRWEGDPAPWMEALGSDQGLLDGPLSYQLRSRRDGVRILLGGDQGWQQGVRRYDLSIEKVLSLKDNGSDLVLAQQLVNKTFHEVKGSYAIETSISLGKFDPQVQQLRVSGGRQLSFEGVQTADEVLRFEFQDRRLGFKVVWDFVKPCQLLLFPVVVPREDGTLDYQCLKLVAGWNIELKGQEKAGFQSTFRIRRRGLLP